ncbi:hypothetical protein ACFE04_006897 [Oxalis oulophora]
MEMRFKQLEATFNLFMHNSVQQHANNLSQFHALQISNLMHPNMHTSSGYHTLPDALTNFQFPHTQHTSQTQQDFGVGFSPVQHQHALPTINHSTDAYEQSFQRLLTLGPLDQRTTIKSLSDNCTALNSNDEEDSSDDNDDLDY